MSSLFRILRTTPMRVLSLCLLTAAAWAAPVKPQLQITGYLISADLDPSVNRLSATADVTFTALEDLTTPTFELNNGLQITKVTDAQGHSLESERLTNNSTVRFTLSTPLAKGASTTYHFEYSGTLKGADTSPVEGIKLASVEDPISILLYAGRWFPMTGLFTNRFTAEMHIRVPSDERVVGSGSGVAASKSLPGNRTEHTFKWAKPGFPGTIIAGRFLEPITAGNMRVYVTEKHKEHAHDFASLAEREYLFMSGTFGQPESTHMNLVELPDDAVSAAWAPEIAAIAGSRIAARNEQRLLSNTLAHQWWGSQVSPATMNDAWITNGMSRYAELMYLEDSSGKNAFQSAITDVSAGALAYDTEPLTTIGRLDPFSPQFQSMTLEKGAMVFHMLRWEMGDDVFTKFLRTILSQYTDKSIHTSNVKAIAEKESSLQLEPFFAQWLDGTGARPSPTNTLSSASATTRASAPLAPSLRTWTSSACRSNFASKPTVKQRFVASTSPALTRNIPSKPSVVPAASASTQTIGSSRARPI
ncbi:M1 family metallopeptidase [Tunturiibacter gelidiferens]|uniref:M1 family metallopeptidase n=1 Tax=Tunturiibacter gelidiferens TaxID=3069689 RepID=UPI003D9B1735